MRLAERQDRMGTELLRLARCSIEYGLVRGEPLPVDYSKVPVLLTELAATFTTLRADGKLRGCCGALDAARPLAEDVAHSAFQAAFRDPRFDPVSEYELDTILLDVSVLSPLEPLRVENQTDLLDQLQPGIDGLVIIADGRRATFLPKVWDTLPEPHNFLAALKNKCGLDRDHWSDRMEFLRYRTTSYAESP